MLIVIAATTGVLILALALVFEELGRAGRLTVYAWGILGIGLLYGPVSAFVYVQSVSGANYYWSPYIPNAGTSYITHPFAAMLLLVGAAVGRFFGETFVRQPRHRTSKCDPNRRRKLIILFCILLATAGIAQGVYAHAYGGYVSMLGYSRMIRSGIFEVHNPFSFLYPLAGFAVMAFLGFFGLMCERAEARVIMLASVALVCSVYVFYSWLGRMGFVVFAMSVPLGYAYMRVRSPYVIMAIGTMLVASGIVLAHAISTALMLNAATSLSHFMARELSFPFASFFAQLNADKYLYTFFKGIFAAPLYLLPSSLINDLVTSPSTLNTEVVIGQRKGMFGVTGEIPVDLLTLAVMQVKFYGVPVVGLIYGMSLKGVQYAVDAIQHPHVRAILEAYISLKVGLLTVAYADPANVVRGNFALIVVLVILYVIDKPSKRRRKNEKVINRNTSLPSTEG